MLLDEPFASMNPQEANRATLRGRGRRDRGMTILLIEHDMTAVMRIRDRIIVLSFGQKITDEASAKVRADPVIIEMYLRQGDDIAA